MYMNGHLNMQASLQKSKYWHVCPVYKFLSDSALLIYVCLLPACPQHFAILLKYVIHVAIPDIPSWVADEMAKLEYQRREAFKVILTVIRNLLDY